MAKEHSNMSKATGIERSCGVNNSQAVAVPYMKNSGKVWEPSPIPKGKTGFGKEKTFLIYPHGK